MSSASGTSRVLADRVREKESGLTCRDWCRNYKKQSLRLRCAAYGLSVIGKKNTLVERLYLYFHPICAPIIRPDPAEEGEATCPANTATHLTVATIPLDELRNIIQKEIVASASYHQETQQSQLAPELLIPVPREAAISQPPAHPLPMPIQMNQQIQGKHLANIKAKEFVDLNTLLPHFVSGIATQSQGPDARISWIDPERCATEGPKIDSALSWFKAWNIYIQGMVSFYPDLAQSMLYYQNSITNMQCKYPPSAWLRYDTTFRKNMAQNKVLAWDRFDEYAHHQLMKCPLAVPSMTAKTERPECYKCFAMEHYTNACPSESFHSQAMFHASHTFSNSPPSRTPPLYHFTKSKK